MMPGSSTEQKSTAERSTGMWYSAERVVELTVLGQPLSILQDNESLNVGTSVWEASLVFANWVERHAHNPHHPLNCHAAAGKRAIELGSGCGVAALSLALLGCQVTATDIPAVLPILKKNIKRNMVRLSPAYTAKHGQAGRVKAACLSWGNKGQVEGLRPPFDVVVATDVVYLEEGVGPLIETLHALSDTNTLVCLGYCLRQQEAHEVFWRQLPLFFSFQKVERGELGHDFRFQNVDLFLLTKR